MVPTQFYIRSISKSLQQRTASSERAAAIMMITTKRAKNEIVLYHLKYETSIFDCLSSAPGMQAHRTRVLDHSEAAAATPPTSSRRCSSVPKEQRLRVSAIDCLHGHNGHSRSPRGLTPLKDHRAVEMLNEEDLLFISPTTTTTTITATTTLVAATANEISLPELQPLFHTALSVQPRILEQKEPLTQRRGGLCQPAYINNPITYELPHELRSTTYPDWPIPQLFCAASEPLPGKARRVHYLQT